MAPAFSTAVLRRITSVFFSSAYKVRSTLTSLTRRSDLREQIKMHWDTLFESDTEVVIDVQEWCDLP